MFIAAIGHGMRPPLGGPCASLGSGEEQSCITTSKKHGPPLDGGTFHDARYEHGSPLEEEWLNSKLNALLLGPVRPQKAAVRLGLRFADPRGSALRMSE